MLSLYGGETKTIILKNTFEKLNKKLNLNREKQSKQRKNKFEIICKTCRSQFNRQTNMEQLSA